MEFRHTSVLLQEAVEALAIKPDGIYVDGTLGGGGHALEIRKRLAWGKLIGIDRDKEALAAATERLQEFQEGVELVYGNYADTPEIIKNLGIEKLDGILLDLGVSSHQFDEASRGFSYRTDDALLDMRMDQSQALTAMEIVNDYPEEDLARIIREYGEERYASRIAAKIVRRRTKQQIRTTGELNLLLEEAIPHKSRKTGGHPSKRTYQALRIATNGELEYLENSLDKMVDCLVSKGRLVIITFHSLEDRIVKQKFKTLEQPCTCPPEFPMCVCGKVSKGRVVTRHPILPTEAEIEANPRARSAKLRVFERA